MTDDAWRPGATSGRWYRTDGCEIVEEVPLPLDELRTYALKLPGQLWRDVESFPTLAAAQAAAPQEGEP